MRPFARSLVGLAILLSPPAALSAVAFQDFGASTFVRAVSRDGSTVVGVYREVLPPHSEIPFRWTESGGLEFGFTTGFPADVSGDGSVMALDVVPDVYRFTDTGGLELIVSGTAASPATATATSSDGSVVVGSRFADPPDLNAFRWSESGGLFDLVCLPHPNPRCIAHDVSADGSVVVGQTRSSALGTTAFRWTEATGLVGLVIEPSGNTVSWAESISSNGEVIVGTAQNGFGAFRWTETTGPVFLGVQANATATNRDGSLIVGGSGLAAGPRAFLWDEANGVRDLADVLELDYGLDLDGYTLDQATDVSDDGRVIVGFATKEFSTVAWMARLGPECDDGIDNDGDGKADWPQDPQCVSAGTSSERPRCSNGLDDDGDGLFDHPDDPGCFGPLNHQEDPECQDGIDNDGDGGVDWDGGGSADPDVNCLHKPWQNRERNVCGLGFELLFALPLLLGARGGRPRAAHSFRRLNTNS